MTENIIPLNPGVVLGHSSAEAEKNSNVEGKWPEDPERLPLNSFDTGIFIGELADNELLPEKLEDVKDDEKEAFVENPENLQWKASEQGPAPIEKGTYRGTQLALVKTYGLIEQRFSSFMDAANFEPLVPSPLTREQKLKFFAFTDGSDNYPPHLNLAGNVEAAKYEARNQRSTLKPWELFSKMRLLQLGTLLPRVLPVIIDGIGHAAAILLYGPMGTPDKGEKLADVENFNKDARQRWFHKDIFNLPNVGDLEDWYSDARFAQQQFTGTNPTTIEQVSDNWLQHFIEAAEKTEDAATRDTIKHLTENHPKSLYMQDYSYFRAAAGLGPDDDIKCEYEEKDEGNTKKSYRYGCASVCLFYLNGSGQLYPLAIVIDWRGSAEKSVTIYNRELIKRENFQSGSDKYDPNKKVTYEAHDWAWRYAKTCVQCSDWLRHEVTVHLVNTHLVEESIIVASNRQLDPDHPVMKLLYPHWQKTLALNAAARNTLVPHVIVKLIGLPDEQAFAFIRHAYKNFDFKKRYVPTDLKERGFPPEKLDDPEFHNYAYARCIHSMWYKIRSFVHDMLKLDYSGDDANNKVKNDERIQAWSAEMRDAKGADLPSFPTIHTFEDLVDCVTMCIHIASPQHTAVNYLQNYYQSFVVNKPPCLYAAPPASLQDLFKYTEKELVKALPMNHTREWLLSSHIPYLLSFKPGDKESLIDYALSKYQLHSIKASHHSQSKEASQKDQRIADIAKQFYQALSKSAKEFKDFGEATDSKNIPYEVLNPDWNAVSILI